MLRVVRKILLGILAGLAGLILLLTIMFLLPGVRGAMLGWAARVGDDALPGSLTVGETKWPSLGNLVLRDVLWTSGSGSAPEDTLADVALLDLRLDLGALRAKEGRVESLRLDVRNLDVPVIVSMTSSMSSPAVADSLAEETPASEFPYLMEGSLPGIPSAALAEMDLEVDRARITPAMVIRDLVLAGRTDVRADRPASAVVEHAEARFLLAIGDTLGAPVWEVDLDELRFGLNLAAVADSLGHWKINAARMDSFRLEIAPTANPGLPGVRAGAEPVILEAQADLTQDGEEYSGRLDCGFVLPGSARFHPWLPGDFPHEEFRSVTGKLGIEGTYENPRAKASLHLDLGCSTWLEHGVMAADLEADLESLRTDWMNSFTVELDTLDIDLDGIRVAGSGAWGGEESGLDVALNLTDVRLPVLFVAAAKPEMKELLSGTDQVNLAATAQVRRNGEKFTGGIDCDFVLPGASHFQNWLPEDFPVDDYEEVAGSLQFQGKYEAPRAGGKLRFDFGSNTWADRGLVAGDAEADLDAWKSEGLRALRGHLDTLEIGVEGIRVSASGDLEPGVLALEFEGEMTDFLLPRLFVGPELAESEIELEVDAVLAGSLDEPEVDAKVSGTIDHKTLAVPSFDFSVTGDRRNVEALLRAGGGLDLNGTLLDSLRTEVRAEVVSLDSLAAGFGMAVWKQENFVALGGSVQGDSIRVVHIDSLVSHAFGREMRTRAPFTFTLGPGPAEFELTNMEISGDLGSIFARGLWNEQERDLETAVDLLIHEELLQEIVPLLLWSNNGGSDLKLDVTAGLQGGQNEPVVTGRFEAFLLPHRESPPFGVDLDFTAQGGPEAFLGADFSLGSPDSVLLNAHLDWPGRAGPDGEFWNPDPEKDLVLTIPPQRLNLDRINRRLPQETILRGLVELEGEVRVFPPGREGAPVDSLALIPLKGSVDAKLDIPGLKIDLPNRSWLETVVEAGVTGPLSDPVVSARVDVHAGFIRIPEIPRNLHQVEGHSYLWALNDSLKAAMDSTIADSLAVYSGPVLPDSQLVFLDPAQAGPVLAPSGPAALPEMEIELNITDDLRVIGYGVDIKLLGSIKATRGYDKDNLPGPSLNGNIHVREGTLKAMNRVFDVERGNIKFTGDVPPNPTFDLMLESQVNAYLVRILISGRADGPVIELTSEPDLGEEDVMAVLLFGQPLSDLDNDQRGRMDEENDPSRELQRNLAGMAMAFGARGIQEGMSDSFGVDMVQMGSDSSGGSTLMVGKFITPDIMLKYNQSLEKSGTYFMTLEYSLNRYFKLVSIYGQGEEESGGEVQWSKRY